MGIKKEYAARKGIDASVIRTKSRYYQNMISTHARKSDEREDKVRAEARRPSSRGLTEE